MRLLPRLYEPVLGRMLGGMRAAARDLALPREGLTVLDVGCGTGAFLAGYAAAGCRVAGLDGSAVMLSEARRRLGTGALLVRGEATALPFSSGAFSLVTAMMLLHCLPADAGRAALAEMARVAGPGGRVLVADHRPGAAPGSAARAARVLARTVEGVAGHGPGVRSLAASGGIAVLAAGAGLEVEATRAAASGVLEVVRLRSGRPGA